MRLLRPILFTAAVLIANQFTAKAVESVGTGPALTDTEQRDARKIYVAKCAKCHEFYAPSDYSSGEWSVWMTKMGKKSRLSAEQLVLMRRYTDELRTNPPPAKLKKP
ncbi:MAG: hypothetical protein HY300_11160 [Verrucomicrobia bacterium]|nr:hypothetical protein [Verrucomicrobiota bacterium]